VCPIEVTTVLYANGKKRKTSNYFLTYLVVKLLIAETISQVFSFLKEHWDLVNQVASDLLRIYIRFVLVADRE